MRIALGSEPIVEIASGFCIDLVTEVHVDALRRILVVQLFSHGPIDVRLAATMVAHQNDVLEASDNGLLANSFENDGKDIVCQSNRAGRSEERRVGKEC